MLLLLAACSDTGINKVGAAPDAGEDTADTDVETDTAADTGGTDTGDTDTAPPPPGRLQLDPLAWDFGVLEAGDSAIAIFTATNVGEGPLALDPLLLDGSGDFTVIDAGGFDIARTLGPGDADTLQLVYAPADVGRDAGTLTLGGIAAPLTGEVEPEPVCTAFDDFATWNIGGTGNWTATGVLTENRSGAYASIAYLPDFGSASRFALQVDTAWRGSLNDYAGLVFGVASGDEYWVVRWDDPNGSYNRYSPSGAIDLSWCSFGACTPYVQETSFDLYWPADASFVTWSMEVTDAQLVVVWNGVTVLDTYVPELVGVGPGPVGLYSNDNDGGVVYDNFCVLVDP